MSLKALAEAVLRGDTPRDDRRDTPSRSAETAAEAPRQQDGTRGEAVLIWARHLDAELWIIATSKDRRVLEDELAREEDHRPVVTADEALHLGGMLESDARALFGAIARIRLVLGGRSIGLGDAGAFDA